MSKGNEIILNQYKLIVDMLGQIFKDSVEVVLHSLQNLEKSVIYIHNGDKTGRTIGSPVTDKALKIIDEFEKTGKVSYGPYRTVARDGHEMKSITSVIVNPKGKAIGLLCINIDLHTPMRKAYNLMFNDFETPEDAMGNNEYFATDLNDLLTNSLNNVREAVYADGGITQRQKNKVIIGELYDAGIFNLRNSVLIISELLHVSRDAIYLHLRTIKNAGPEVQKQFRLQQRKIRDYSIDEPKAEEEDYSFDDDDKMY